MNFVIHFNYAGFIADIPVGSTVYTAAFTEVQLQEKDAVVLLTSEAGVAGGTIHAVRLTIEKDDQSDAFAVAGNAVDIIRELLVLKGMSWRQGIVLTEGLDDALRYYGKTSVNPTLKVLDEFLTKERAGRDK